MTLEFEHCVQEKSFRLSVSVGLDYCSNKTKQVKLPAKLARKQSTQIINICFQASRKKTYSGSLRKACPSGAGPGQRIHSFYIDFVDSLNINNFFRFLFLFSLFNKNSFFTISPFRSLLQVSFRATCLYRMTHTFYIFSGRCSKS